LKKDLGVVSPFFVAKKWRKLIGKIEKVEKKFGNLYLQFSNCLRKRSEGQFFVLENMIGYKVLRI